MFQEVSKRVTNFFDNNKKEEAVVRHQRRESDRPPTGERIKRMHDSPRSFTNLLPWHEYHAASNTFVLGDGKSHGIMFELRAIGTEGSTSDYMDSLQRVIQTALTETLPEDHLANWVIQFYVQDDSDLASEVDVIRKYVKSQAKESNYTTEYLNQLEEHYKQISQHGGLFVDHLTTGAAWAGKIRRVRVCIYRYIAEGMEPEWEQDRDEINEIGERFQNQLNTTGIKLWRTTGLDLYEWMFKWFNPRPLATNGDVEAFLKLAPYPGDENLPTGYDLAEMLVHTYPRSEEDSGLWYFDEMPHKVVTVGALRRVPQVGLMTAERKQGENTFASFDRFPEDSILSVTIQIKPQDEVQNHVTRIKQASYGDSAEASASADEADIAQQHLVRGNKLYPIQMVVYIRGKSKKQIQERERIVYSQLLAANLQPIDVKADLLIQDSYIRNLPMNYDPVHDQKNSHRSMLVYSSQIASLLPVYGRERGTGHPGWAFFNRGGEPLTVDPLNSLDRSKNAHALIIGPTGAGKSATLVYLIQQALAIYRPRIFVIEAGNSFGLLGDYLQEHDVSVNQITLNKSSDVSLPPFALAQQLLVDKKQIGLELSLTVENDDSPLGEDEDEDEDEDRDLLGEMEIAARIMITGGDAKEADALMRADRTIIRKAILSGAEYSKSQGRDQTLTEDVVYGLRNQKGLEGKRKERAELMADGMELFCNGLAGHFFNREGIAWPDKDLTIVDMGILAREGYEDQLTVAYIGLMNHIHSLVEREQHSERQTIVITDEGHIITTNPLLAPYVIKIVKMWRKLGAWYWIATQNLEDFPDASRKMLNMLEWWMCLVMPKDEIEQIARFKDLTQEQKAKLLSAKKSSGQYTEGVILTDDLNISFRNVPPALTLALAMTEKEEKSERMGIMKEKGCTEAQAAEVVAKKIIQRREQNIHG